MRTDIFLCDHWQFFGPNGHSDTVGLPHTWNALDGADGGDDYFRGSCRYEKIFSAPELSPDRRLYLEFQGANASARVSLNGTQVLSHDGGYSTFRADITEHLCPENHLVVELDNAVNDRVYPQKADFTFYGGIYRDVKLISVHRHHFDLDYFGSSGLAVDPRVEGTDGKVRVRTWHNCPEGTVDILLKDHAGNTVATGTGTDVTLTVPHVHLWDGIRDPYLYNCIATLYLDGQACDRVETRFGVRTFHADPKKGFFLNSKPYPLRGVCRHQDRKAIGNALTRAHHDEDMALIREIGANTIRLAHYQHDSYFYDLCDQYGMIVWAEIPYISEHMPAGRENTLSQMRELIVQNYNHPSIVTWGISNEITISTKDKKDMLDNHRELNDMVHRLDPHRLTSLACYAVCSPFHKVAHITDLVSWNLYLGWYVPGLFLNDLWIDFFHWKYPNRCLGYSEYGCEGMPNLHSNHPHRGDHTEEYQAIYHEYMLKCFEKRPFMWANHVWNMFDFAADARNQGGEPGMNHKGLVTFDRKLKKDCFYLYKAYWTEAPFVYLAGRRYEYRTEAVTDITVYSTCKEVSLYNNGKLVETKKGEHVFKFKLPMEATNNLEVKAGDCVDSAVIYKTDKPRPEYSAAKVDSSNWM